MAHELDRMLALQLEGKHQEARQLSDYLEELGPDRILDGDGNNTSEIWLRHRFNRGWFKLQEGEYQEGCQMLDSGRFLNVYGNPPLQTPAPIYNPQKHDLKDKALIIALEGGYGDEIIHARFATTFKKLGAGKVYLACSASLASVLGRIEGVDGTITRDKVHTIAHDYWLPGFSAGWLSKTTFETLSGTPYLTPVQASVDMWKTIIDMPENTNKIKIGIRWAGNPKFEHQQFRRFPTNFITNLSKYEGVQLYSLQRDHNIIPLPENVVDLQHLIISWEDTMAAIANLDIVITSCTSVAHLAAAMGKETWIMVPILPYHTWTYGAPSNDTSPYYNCVKLFRQTAPKKWNDAFQSMYAALEERFNLDHIELPDEDVAGQKLNMGCGLNKMTNYVNADKSPLVNPDVTVDFEVTPWPWADNTFDHIVAKDILEHLGDTKRDFIDIIKEMYRVSMNGAIWEVQIPHWRCDLALDDPTHKQLLTTGTFSMFDKRYVHDRILQGGSESLIAFEHDIDLDISAVEFQYTAPYMEKMQKGEIEPEQLAHDLNHYNNVAETARLLIQVNKPGRFNDDDLIQLMDTIEKRKQ